MHVVKRQIEPGPSIGETERSGHIAGAVDLNDADADMLVVVRAAHIARG